MKNWPKMGQKVVKYWQNSGHKWTQNGPKMNPKIVSENLIPAHFESFFWGLYLANFGPLVAWEGLFGNQKCKKFWPRIKINYERVFFKQHEGLRNNKQLKVKSWGKNYRIFNRNNQFLSLRMYISNIDFMVLF